MHRVKTLIWYAHGLVEQNRVAAARCFSFPMFAGYLGHPHSYISHISNRSVLDWTGQESPSHVLLGQQLKLYGRFVCLPAESTVRKSVLLPGDVLPRSFAGKRRRGRPRANWTVKIVAAAQAVAGSTERLRGLLLNPRMKGAWPAALSAFFARDCTAAGTAP